MTATNQSTTSCSGRGYHSLPATHDEPPCERDCAACEGTGVEDLDADGPECAEWEPSPSYRAPHAAVHRGTPECEVCGAFDSHPIHHGGVR